MAYNNIHGQVETYIAGADLSSSQYLFVKVSGANVVVAGDGEAAVGVLWNDPTSGKAASVVRGGDPHVYAGAAIAAGIDIASDAAGKAVAATTGDIILGTTRAAAAASGDLVQINFITGGNAAA
tara:strand:- start:2598 stop:2969 length:372 start_codon:yes stop_codon:yes gene_type:complete